MNKTLFAKRIKESRKMLYDSSLRLSQRKAEAEGGCGVVGFACSEKVTGKHVLAPLIQMHNRGNGKGGGVIAVGLSPEQMGVSAEILEKDYLIQIAFLDPAAKEDVEKDWILPFFDIHRSYCVPTMKDYREVNGLEIRPPDVWRYFCRVKENVLDHFIKENSLDSAPLHNVEDEFVYQNSYKLNKCFYASLGEKRAFVLSHGRNMIVFKIVGYAEQAIQYYQLTNIKANIWVGHQRYPTKGRVWHPGGAHPFIGLNEALVHNGDFANYYAICEYLKQHSVFPLFLTDTEISVLLFDLWDRIYGYPLEYIIEALAPTTERDFTMLTPEKKQVYRAIQTSHIHSSPDGPWFFIIARNKPNEGIMQLLGITDTSMLRPQVFALQEGEINVGLIASEKQAIDATLRSLASEDSRFCPIADKYWNARGGSYTDGGAFAFTLTDDSKSNGIKKLTCTDKFGQKIVTLKHQGHINISIQGLGSVTPCTKLILSIEKKLIECFEDESPVRFFNWIVPMVRKWDYNIFHQFCVHIVKFASKGDDEMTFCKDALTLFYDRWYDVGVKKRSIILAMLEESLYTIFRNTQYFKEQSTMSKRYYYVDWKRKNILRNPENQDSNLVINAYDFPSEGNDSIARFMVEAYRRGWRRFIVFAFRGQRFCACGLGPRTKGLCIEIYGTAGDYLASGLDGAEVHVHGTAQDQVGQILKDGNLVIHGDVGQTFLYGAKGGEIYVLGNAAGRPLINAVGHPRVVINGTCLDYLAESFMAGDALRGGGFVIMNGVEFDGQGVIRELPTPFPGGNLFSLASGGAIYIRDPHKLLGENQLNGGRFAPLSKKDCLLIKSYLEKNERLFGISIEELLTVNGQKKKFEEVYRKIEPIELAALT